MKNLEDEKDVWREKMQRNKWNIQRIHSFIGSFWGYIEINILYIVKITVIYISFY